VNRALIVMAKEPKAGGTKTRLSPPLTSQGAAELYQCFLMDTLELMRRLDGVRPIVAYLPFEAESYFQRIAPPGFDFIPQVGADLGERLDNVMTHCLQGGFDQAAVMDSDSPTLPLALLQQAFRDLADPGVDAVLGPCDDGGYYLVGLKSPCPALFRGVVMSTETVAEETLKRAQEQGLEMVCLPRWYDVDTYEDLQRLVDELDSRPDQVAEHTRTFLSGAGGGASRLADA
jgi:rSAM/selenodomain-associated transferase 1